MAEVATEETESDPLFPVSRVVDAEKFSETQLQAISLLSKECGISEITASLLVRRGFETVEDASKFLLPTLKDCLEDPSTIKGMAEAAEQICTAIKENRFITVYCDFDVDGLSSGSQMVSYLRQLGGKVNWYTPDRFTEGYGLVSSAVEKIVKAGCQFLITVDCGITNHREIELAKRLGLRVVVLDHHEPEATLPPADVIVDPAQEGCPFQEHRLAAAGLVWMLLIVLRKVAPEILSLPPKDIPDPKDFLDLAALGTICDMVPLKTLNRVIAYRGLEALERSSRPGVIALKNASGIDRKKKMNSGHVGFGLGPRINAAGRLDHGGKVLELLTTGDPKRAERIATSLNKLNTQRRSIEDAVKASCISQILTMADYQNQPAFALFGDDFHLGVIGIAAQRVVEKFYRPVAVMAPAEEVTADASKQVVKGSVRSISGFHVAEVLQELSPLLIGGGGHAAAGGFSLLAENLEAFQLAFIEQAGKRLSEDDFTKTKTADLEIPLKAIDLKLVDELQKLSPFGIGNATPLLCSKNVQIVHVLAMSNGHLKLRVEQEGTHLQVVAWSYQGHPLLRKGEFVNIAYFPEINSYRGISSVQLTLKEVWQD